ncbi:hypothetical protein F52700_2418 [Fusarium sp. NRRL 52700]|nr:hypothetical protein F52700_2418 [Fusarium sp. NRRL 52700]
MEWLEATSIVNDGGSSNQARFLALEESGGSQDFRASPNDTAVYRAKDSPEASLSAPDLDTFVEVLANNWGEASQHLSYGADFPTAAHAEFGLFGVDSYQVKPLHCPHSSDERISHLLAADSANYFPLAIELDSDRCLWLVVPRVTVAGVLSSGMVGEAAIVVGHIVHAVPDAPEGIKAAHVDQIIRVGCVKVEISSKPLHNGEGADDDGRNSIGIGWLSAIKFDRANKDNVTFHIAAAGVDNQCYLPGKDAVAPGRIYKCGENAAVAFSYTGEDGKLSVWLSNENGSFASSTLLSGPVSDEIAIDLVSLNG